VGNDLIFNILYRGDAQLMRALVLESLDRLQDRSWPRDLPLHNLDLLRAAFFILMNKDLTLKQCALDGLPPLIAQLDRRKAEAFYLALEPEAVRPFLSNFRKPHRALVDAVKNLYLSS
jgi:hypothetical protein